MPKLMFWNVERLGGSTAQHRRDTILAVMRTMPDCDYYLFCEMTSGSTNPAYQNITYRVASTSQLGYAATTVNMGPGGRVNFADHVLTRLPSPRGRPAGYGGFPGGNTFSDLVDRAPALVANLGGVVVYVIHCPSTHNGFGGQRALSYLACAFEAALPAGTQWMVLGDLNVTPTQLRASPVAAMPNYIDEPPEETYRGFSSNSKLDYSVSSAALNVQVEVLRRSPRDSDHRPIIVSW